MHKIYFPDALIDMILRMDDISQMQKTSYLIFSQLLLLALVLVFSTGRVS